MSWMYAKILPYIFFFLLGVVCFFFIRKRLNSKVLKWSSAIILVPFVVYFLFDSTYERDFTNNYKVRSDVSDVMSLSEVQLTIIATPGYTLCMESIEMLKKMKERTIRQFISSYSDYSSSLRPYSDEANRWTKINQVTDIELFENISRPHFPELYLKR